MDENKEPVENTEQKSNGGKTTKIAVIVAAVVIVCLAAYFGVTKVVIPNKNYNAAVALMNEGKYEEAIAVFEALDGYKDSAENAKRLFIKIAEVGDYVCFGAYEQDKDTSDGKESVEWQVLAKEDNKILVISKYVLDAKPYNTELWYVTWETCTLRTWLNKTFLDEAFGEAEQSMIQTNATEDRIFLLSIDEANKYFATDEARMCAPTASARAKGAYTDDNRKVDGEATCCWWLRSPGRVQFFAANVYYDGGVNSFGNNYTYGLVGVRPAMWISLDA